MKQIFTAVYKKRPGAVVAWIEEIPGVNTQGKTKAEAMENLKEALALVLAENRKSSLKGLRGDFLRERILVS